MNIGDRLRGVTVGALAAGMPLAVGEFVASLADRLRSPIVAVGDLLVDVMPGVVVRASISTLGSAQKPLLLTGIVAVTLALGGLLCVRMPTRVPAALTTFGALGGWAMARSPLASTAGSLLLAFLMVGTGLAVLKGAPRSSGQATDATGPLEDPRLKYADRRNFLAYAGGMSTTAVALVGAGRFISDRSAQEARARFELPTTTAPSTTTAPPPTTAATTTAPPPTTAAPPSLPAVDGLDPWITPNADFYRIDTALTVPIVDPTDWSLTLNGLVAEPVTLTLDDLLAMDVLDATVTLACVSNPVGGPLIGNAVWTGVLLTDVLDLVDPLPEAEQVLAWSVDGFSAGFPLATAVDGRTALVAFGMNGEPLPLAHGFPVRLVVPGLYGYVSAVKWLSQLELSRFDRDGFWIDKGWSKDAPVKISSRIDVPVQNRVEAGTVPVAGVAWYPDVGVAAVEVSVDFGPWQACRLGEADGPGLEGEAWVQWLHLWEPEPGRYRIRVRAFGSDGTMQSPERVAPAPNGAEGYHEISVTVT